MNLSNAIVQNSKILGIMWHPERYKNLKQTDKKLLKQFL